MSKFKRKKRIVSNPSNKTSNKISRPPVKKSYLKLIKTFLLDSTNGKNGNGDKNNPHHNAGAKTKLTPSVQKTILNAIELGMPTIAACQLVGVTQATYCNWINWGEKEMNKIKELLDFAVKELSEQDKLNTDNPIEMEEFIDAFIKTQTPNKFFKFFNSVKGIEAKGHAKALQSIRQAQEGGQYLTEVKIEKDPVTGDVVKHKEVMRYLKPDWNAGAWWLERKYPGLYGQRVLQEGHVDHNHEHRHKHSVEIPKSDERVAGVLSILLGSGFVSRGLIECSPRKPADQRVIDA